MLKKSVLLLIIQLLCVIHLFAELRSFDAVFPNLSPKIRTAAFSNNGYQDYSKRADGFNLIGSRHSNGIDPQITDTVLERNPGFIVESITVIPGRPGAVTLLDVYNSLGNIRGLKGIEYFSETKKKYTPLFEDATRVASEKQMTVIDDPPPAEILPRSETVFLRLKDTNFGNSYYRGEMMLIQNGLSYTLTNFRNLSYLFFTVIREGSFTAQLYFEPIQEGVLIYSLAGSDVSDFAASKIDIPSAIAKRLKVIISWAADGISAD